ncbi:hypothetical protein CRG98_049422, partial [Punica granatum]
MGEETRQGRKKHEPAGLVNLRSMKVNSHGCADPARQQEAQASRLGEIPKNE